MADEPDTLRELQSLADDVDATPERRAAARGALAEIAEHRAQAEVLTAARVVAAAWDDVKTRFTALEVYAWQMKRGDQEGARARGSMIVALDALRLHVREAREAADGEST